MPTKAIQRFMTKIDQTLETQSKLKCPISGWNYYEKFSYFDAYKFLWKTELESLLEWSEGRTLENVYVIASYAGVGTAFAAIDEQKEEWKNITDYETW